MNQLRIKQINHNQFKITLELPLANQWYDNVVFHCFNSKDYFWTELPHKDNDNGIIKFENVIDLPDSALYNTYISCKIDGEEYYLNKDHQFTSNLEKKDMRKISVNFNVPEWCQGAMIYHIFVDRFYRSDTSKLIQMPRRSIHLDTSEQPQLGPDQNGIYNNDFYGGDLKGITEKLDFIRAMGFTVLYLSPIVESQSTHRYDTANYLRVDPYAGTMQDLKELCDKAHQLGMRVILDAVFNHTGNDSVYFDEYDHYGENGAHHNPDSPYYKFYKQRYNEKTGCNEFKFWWNIFKNLPECNSDSPEWQEFICGRGGVIDQWFECGIDGLRLDVADELSDQFIERIREACERNKKDSFIYGEVWERSIYQGRNYIMSGHGMHSIMNYKGMDAMMRYYLFPEETYRLQWAIDEILSEYPKEVRDSLMNSTSTHDISRSITLFGAPYLLDPRNQWIWNVDNENHDFIRNFRLTEEEYQRGRDKYLSYLIAIAFMSGNFTVFAGDEAGQQGLGNLQNRGYYPWDNIDTVIQDVVTNIGRITESNPFLKKAEMKSLHLDPNLFIYERYNDQEKLLICANPREQVQPIEIPSEYKQKVYTLKKSTPNYINPYGAIIMKTN